MEKILCCCLRRRNFWEGIPSAKKVYYPRGVSNNIPGGMSLYVKKKYFLKIKEASDAKILLWNYYYTGT